jgi:hypothetical protein
MGFAGHFMVSGVVLGNLGGVLLTWMTRRRDQEDERRAQVQQRLDRLAGEDPPELTPRAPRPSLFLPGLMMSGGTLLTAVSVPLLGSVLPDSTAGPWPTGMSVAFVCAGITAAALGVFWLINELRDHDVQ